MSRVLWVVFALFIVYGTTIPFQFQADHAVVRARVHAMPLNPLRGADGRRVSIPDSVQNVMLFLPFGILGALSLKGGVRTKVGTVAVVTGAALALSATVEFFQLFTADRISSVSDMTTNALGGLIGAAFALTAEGTVRSALRTRRIGPWLDSEWAYPSLVALAVLLVAAWQPFDATLDVGSVVSKVRLFVTDPWQGGPLTDEVNALVLYALTTMALAACLRAGGMIRSAQSAFGIVGLLAVLLELSQFFVSSRMPSVRDACVRVAGAAIGAIAAHHVRRRRASVWLAVLVLLTVASAAQSMLSPFVTASIVRPFAWFPFLGYYRGSWFPILSHVIEAVLLYFPLGFCLGLARGRGSLGQALGLCLAIAIGIEYTQSWIVGRFADVTDIAVSALGGVGGAWCALRAPATMR